MRPVKRQTLNRHGILGLSDSPYGMYRGLLLSDLGSYCSYCEIVLTHSVEVEHKVAKGAIATWDNLWDNFLLACKNCNASKGDKPNQGFGKGEKTYAKNYIWPDGWDWPSDEYVGTNPYSINISNASNFFTYKKNQMLILNQTVLRLVCGYIRIPQAMLERLLFWAVSAVR